MGPRGMRDLLKAVAIQDSKLKFKLWWIDIKYGFLEWFCQITKKLRMRHTKKLVLLSHAYYDFESQLTWDDIEVYDQWGLWFPLGFGIMSKHSWEWDNKGLEEEGLPAELWKDEEKCSCSDHEECGWTTYYFKDEYLNSNHYLKAGKKHLSRELGDQFTDKELEVKLLIQSQKQLNVQMLQEAEWIKGGKKPLKVEFSDQAKKDLTDIMGEAEAKKLFEQQEERNRKLDEESEE